MNLIFKSLPIFFYIAYSCFQIDLAVADEMNFCYGAIFNSPTPSEKMEPLAGKQVPFPYDCDDEEGRKNCQQLCITNADAEKSNAGMILCPLLGKTDEPFIPHVFYRMCNRPTDKWTYTGLTPTIKICCADKQEVPCP